MQLASRALHLIRSGAPRWAWPAVCSIAVAFGLYSPLVNGDPGRIIGAGSVGANSVGAQNCTANTTNNTACGSVSGKKCTEMKTQCVTTGDWVIVCQNGGGNVNTDCFNSNSCTADNNASQVDGCTEVPVKKQPQ